MRGFDRGREGSPKSLLALGLYLFDLAVIVEFHSKHHPVMFGDVTNHDGTMILWLEGAS